MLFPVSLVQREEEERKEEERRRTTEQRRRLEKERILKERRDAEERDRKMDEKLRMIEEQRSDFFPSPVPILTIQRNIPSIFGGNNRWIRIVRLFLLTGEEKQSRKKSCSERRN